MYGYFIQESQPQHQELSEKDIRLVHQQEMDDLQSQFSASSIHWAELNATLALQVEDSNQHVLDADAYSAQLNAEFNQFRTTNYNAQTELRMKVMEAEDTTKAAMELVDTQVADLDVYSKGQVDIKLAELTAQYMVMFQERDMLCKAATTENAALKAENLTLSRNLEKAELDLEKARKSGIC